MQDVHPTSAATPAPLPMRSARAARAAIDAADRIDGAFAGRDTEADSEKGGVARWGAGGGRRNFAHGCMQVAQYLYHTANFAMTYDGSDESLGLEPVAMCDSDWSERHSIHRGMGCLPCREVPASYASRKERCVALSSTEAEI